MKKNEPFNRRKNKFLTEQNLSCTRFIVLRPILTIEKSSYALNLIKKKKPFNLNLIKKAKQLSFQIQITVWHKMQLFSAAVKNAEKNIFETKLQSLLSQQSNFKIAEKNV